MKRVEPGNWTELLEGVEPGSRAEPVEEVELMKEA